MYVELDLLAFLDWPLWVQIVVGLALWYFLFSLVIRIGQDEFDGDDLFTWMTSPVWMPFLLVYVSAVFLFGLVAFVLSAGLFRQVWTKKYWQEALGK